MPAPSCAAMCCAACATTLASKMSAPLGKAWEGQSASWNMPLEAWPAVGFKSSIAQPTSWSWMVMRSASMLSKPANWP